jgi:hypothetical protein
MSFLQLVTLCVVNLATSTALRSIIQCCFEDNALESHGLYSIHKIIIIRDRAWWRLDNHTIFHVALFPFYIYIVTSLSCMRNYVAKRRIALQCKYAGRAFCEHKCSMLNGVGESMLNNMVGNSHTAAINI